MAKLAEGSLTISGVCGLYPVISKKKLLSSVDKTKIKKIEARLSFCFFDSVVIVCSF